MHDFKTKVNGSLTDVHSLTSSGSADLQKSIQPIINEINEIYSTATADFTAAYIAYTTNPCEKDKDLSIAVERINASTSRLTSLKIRAHAMKNKSSGDER